MITDHEDIPRMLGRWKTGTCAVCSKPTRRHLSYGQSIAALIGGRPEDYVEDVDG